MNTPIQLIVGLGNPGTEYAATRHNAGAWFVEKFAEHTATPLRAEAKFKGLQGQAQAHGHPCWLLIPTTFMNLSGQAVRALADFYKIAPAAILIVHDDLDLPVGVSRLKFDGGHGGHNGLRDIIKHLNTPAFHRLRIGIAHPGDRHPVKDYVLKPPGKTEKAQIDTAIDDALRVVPDLLQGNLQKAMKQLHTR